jgi:type II secretory pathway predicted ATPase ExeA
MLDSKEQRGRTIILIIDEAHLLRTASFQELRLLTNSKMDSFDLFFLILAGQIDLRKTMDLGVMESFSQRITLKHTMPPLNPADTVDYIERHMKIAGASVPFFSQDALSALYEVSFGIPRRISIAAEISLTLAMLEGK